MSISPPANVLTALLELVVIPLGLGVAFTLVLWLLLPRGRRRGRPPKSEP